MHSLAAAARTAGVTIHEHEPVTIVGTNGSGFSVVTDTATYCADRLIVTAGAWAGQMLSGLGLPLTILRKVLFWFATDHPDRFTLGAFPIFIADSSGQYLRFPTGR